MATQESKQLRLIVLHGMGVTQRNKKHVLDSHNRKVNPKEIGSSENT